MRIQHNIMAMSAYRNYTNNVSAMKKNLEKLSSGYKINRAGDDAAGLAISEKMRAQITGLETAQKNAKDGISLVQTAEGALTEVHDMLNRMVELATQSANGTYENTTDRTQLQKELDQLRSEINRIADSSNFNGIKLLDGSMSDNTEVSAVTVTNAAASAGSTTYSYSDVTDLFGAIPATGAASTSTILHTEGSPAAKGEFVIALDQLSVGAPNNAGSAAKVKISLTYGSKTATATVAATTNGVGMSGATIASKMQSGAGKYLVVKANGSIAFAASSAAVKAAATGALVYTAGPGTDPGTVKYTLTGYNTSNATTVTLADTTAIKNLTSAEAAKISAAAKVGLNFKVAAESVTNMGALTDNRQNRGTLDVVQTSLQEKATFGNAVVSFTEGKIKDGMKITIGAGTGTHIKSISIKTKADTLATAADGSIVDLTAFCDASGNVIASKALDAKNAIADAFGSLTGIHVGIDASGNITLSEKTNAQGSSAANTATKEAMASVSKFGTLLKVEQRTGTAGAAAKATSTINVSDNVYEGNSIKLTIDNQDTTFVFTSDTEKLNLPASKVPANTKYINLGTEGGAAEALRTAVKTVVGSKGTVSSKVVDGKFTVTVTGTAGASTVSGLVASIAASATGVWTGNTGLMLQIGDTADDFNQLKVNINDMHTKAMVDAKSGLSIADISIQTQEDAAKAIDVIKSAVNYVSDVRGTLGATQNRLDHTINNLSVMTENIQDAESTIRDVDVAEEMMAYTKNNILIQSAQAMLAQANQVPQGVLQLLQ